MPPLIACVQIIQFLARSALRTRGGCRVGWSLDSSPNCCVFSSSWRARSSRAGQSESRPYWSSHWSFSRSTGARCLWKEPGSSVIFDWLSLHFLVFSIASLAQQTASTVSYRLRTPLVEDQPLCLAAGSPTCRHQRRWIQTWTADEHLVELVQQI